MAGTTSPGKARSSRSSVNQTKQYIKGSNNFYRKDDEKKIRRVKMVANGGKAIRDRDGKIIKEAEFQSKEAGPGRVQPDRRWFGG